MSVIRLFCMHLFSKCYIPMSADISSVALSALLFASQREPCYLQDFYFPLFVSSNFLHISLVFAKRQRIGNIHTYIKSMRHLYMCVCKRNVLNLFVLVFTFCVLSAIELLSAKVVHWIDCSAYTKKKKCVSKENYNNNNSNRNKKTMKLELLFALSIALRLV